MAARLALLATDTSTTVAYQQLGRLRRLAGTPTLATVADVHARFLGHGLAAGDPTQPAARPPDRGLWYRDLFEPNAWGASQIRATCWETLQTSLAGLPGW